ncbi:hypothetical protein Tco_1317929 [Tanacetum coccineum]
MSSENGVQSSPLPIPHNNSSVSLLSILGGKDLQSKIIKTRILENLRSKERMRLKHGELNLVTGNRKITLVTRIGKYELMLKSGLKEDVLLEKEMRSKEDRTSNRPANYKKRWQALRLLRGMKQWKSEFQSMYEQNNQVWIYVTLQPGLKESSAVALDGTLCLVDQDRLRPIIVDDLSNSKEGKTHHYLDSMRNLRFTLRYGDKEYVLDKQIPTINDDSTEEEIEAYQKHYDDANKAKASKERLDVVKSLMACKPKPEASIYDFVLEMNEYFDKMESLNIVFDAEISINIILSSLPAEYNQFVLSYQMNEKESLIMELHSLLQTDKHGIKKIVVPSTSAAPVLTVESEIAPTSDPKEVVCFYCNIKGHWKRSYPKYLKDLKDGKGLKESRRLKHREINLDMGNRKITPVTRIGKYELMLKSGVMIDLNN